MYFAIKVILFFGVLIFFTLFALDILIEATFFTNSFACFTSVQSVFTQAGQPFCIVASGSSLFLLGMKAKVLVLGLATRLLNCLSNSLTCKLTKSFRLSGLQAWQVFRKSQIMWLGQHSQAKIRRYVDTKIDTKKQRCEDSMIYNREERR